MKLIFSSSGEHHHCQNFGRLGEGGEIHYVIQCTQPVGICSLQAKMTSGKEQVRYIVRVCRTPQVLEVLISLSYPDPFPSS